MKKMKKIMALVLAAIMCMTMSIGVFAADNTSSGNQYTITIKKDTTDKAAHTYGAYQLFKGKLEKVDGSDVLSDIQWGDNINVSTFITALKKISIFESLADNASAATVAKAISDAKYGDDTSEAQALADAFNAAITGNAKASGTIAAEKTEGTIGIDKSEAGYYLIKDTADVKGEGAQTRYILEVVKDVTVTEKANVPSVTKKVKEKNDSKDTSTTDPKNPTDWQDAADYDINDSIPYKLEGTLPGKFAEYDTYKVYTFTDTLSAGLTPPTADEVKVTLDTEDGADLVKAQIFEVKVEGQVITVKLKDGVDLKTANVDGASFSATSKIIVTYNAVLNEKAKLGAAGNENTVKLDFTNNPNGEQDGKFGSTPEDKVIVFTFEIKSLKVAPTDDAAIDQTAYDALDDEEKADYVKVGDKWQKVQALTGAGFTLYKKVPIGTEGAVDGYVKIGNEIKGEAISTFKFTGTDAGEYKLVETTVPAGYNKAADITFTVSATYDTTSDDPKLTALTIDASDATFTVEAITYGEGADAVNSANAIASTTVINQKGSTLPSTGGIGTTIFYVLGAILVIGAGLVLVTKKRMGAEK